MSEMEFTDDELNALVNAGVLEQEGAFPTPEGVHWSFRLATPYYERWVSRHYPAKR